MHEVNRRYIQVWIALTSVLDVVGLAEVHDVEQRVGVASQRRPAGQQDEVERSILVLVSELDRCFTDTAGRVVVTSHVAVTDNTKLTLPQCYFCHDISTTLTAKRRISLTATSKTRIGLLRPVLVSIRRR